MKLREILKRLCPASGEIIIQSEDRAKYEVNQAIKDIRELLPKKKDYDQRDKTVYYIDGYNSCIYDMEKGMGIE